jgi:hypothetical protein
MQLLAPQDTEETLDYCIPVSKLQHLSYHLLKCWTVASPKRTLKVQSCSEYPETSNISNWTYEMPQGFTITKRQVLFNDSNSNETTGCVTNVKQLVGTPKPALSGLVGQMGTDCLSYGCGLNRTSSYGVWWMKASGYNAESCICVTSNLQRLSVLFWNKTFSMLG